MNRELRAAALCDLTEAATDLQRAGARLTRVVRRVNDSEVYDLAALCVTDLNSLRAQVAIVETQLCEERRPGAGRRALAAGVA